ncbi:MAG: HD domain-containing phosphohydrolase [Deltaproteobacteria bacterium]
MLDSDREPPRETGGSILLVDDDAGVRDVISVLLTEEGYVVQAVPTAEQALEVAAVGDTHLVISDLKMPGRDGLWLLDQMRKEHPDATVIMLTGFGDTEAAVECLRRGAADYLLKPPKVTELVRAIERALSRRRIELARRRYQRKLERKVQDKTLELSKALSDVEASYHSTLLALVAALDAREHETSDHSQRVVRFTKAIARTLGLGGHELAEIGRGALLHDIGKIGVPDSILLKPGPLTKEEWVEMRRHPDIGFQILKSIPFLTTPAEIVLSHQERFDGGGYPRGLAGEQIPIGSRIFAIADTFDAITSDRPYRKGQSYDAARAEIARCSKTQFDPQCVEAFLALDNERLLQLRAAVAQLDA